MSYSVSDKPSPQAEAVRALARASRLLERASGELSLAHYRVLAAIASGDERASRIATRLAIGKPAISATVESLCQRNLLQRFGVSSDQRVAVLRLTGEGEAVLGRVEAAMVAQLLDLCARVPDGEQLIKSMVWLGAAIEEVMSRAPTGTIPTNSRAIASSGGESVAAGPLSAATDP